MGLHVGKGEVHLSEPPRLASFFGLFPQLFFFFFLLLLCDLRLRGEALYEVFIRIWGAVDVEAGDWTAVRAHLEFAASQSDLI